MLASVRAGRRSAFLLSALLVALYLPSSALGDVVLGDGDNLTTTGYQQTMEFGEVCEGDSYDLTAGIVLLRNGTNTDRIWVNSATIDLAVVTATSGLSATTPVSATLPSDWQTQPQGTALLASSSVVTLTPIGPPGAKTGTIEYSATGASITNTSWTDTDLMQVTWTVVDCAEISITKSVDADYVVVGDDIPYVYEVENTGTVDLFDVTVIDDACSPVEKVTNGNGTLEPGEIWEYECEMPATLAQASTLLANTAEVSAFTDGEDEVTDEDSFTLQALALRKQVAIYWDYLNFVTDPDAGDVAFTANLYKDAVLVGEETFSRNSPLYVWLTPGAWSIEEATPPVGYRIFRGSWNVGTVPSTSYLDNTFFNGSDFDLAITKSGPKLVEVGEDVVYTYSVTNTGPAAVTPLVSDDECSPVAYVDGDTSADGKIQATETWTFSCTTTTTQGDWAGAFPAGDLTNTATVIDDELDDLAAPYGLFGGDTDLTNNEDTYSLYPFVLRKDVRLYDDGGSIPFSDPSTMFTVKATMDGFTDYLMITEDDPAYLWLADGTWTFQETGIPQGYYPLHEYYATGFTHTTGQYPDWTIVNITWSGCSHGYWKNHLDAWPTGYAPSDLIGTYFPESDYFDNTTLEEALAFGGGGGAKGAEKILLRQAVASLLNEAEYGTAFGPYVGVDALKSAVNAALESGDRSTMLDLAGTLGYWNNGVCR